MDTQPKPLALDIAICMGSSCYSRGNGRTIDAIRRFLAQQETEANIVGHLCEDQCKTGPNIAINNRRYSQVDATTVVSILQDAERR